MINSAIKIVDVLRQADYQALFCGGFVRDMLMNKESQDIDIATSALPEQIEQLFEYTIPVGKNFGVIIVVLNGIEFEVATFRNDGNYSDGRRPDSVSFSTMEEDAKRRDITINGMFYCPIEQKVFDFVNGQEDIKNKKIRLIGNPYDRINEDKLRMLRVIRFAARLDFEIEQSTYDAVCHNAKRINLVSEERLFNELTKILRARRPRIALNLLIDSGLIDNIIPEIKMMDGTKQPEQFHSEDVLGHTISALELLPENASDELLWGTLLHDIGKPKTQTFEDRIRFNNHDFVGAQIAKDILKRLRAPNDFCDQVISFVENHMRFMFVKNMKTSKLLRFIRMPKFDEHMLLHYADCMASHGGLDNYYFLKEKLETIEPEEIRPPKIFTGHDLISLGFEPGPVFKQILEVIEDLQLEGKISNKEEALSFVGSNYQRG